MIPTSALQYNQSVDAQELPLRPFFEKIIDKKVNQVALSIFESIVDFLCNYLYPSYHNRLVYRLEEVSIDQEELNSDDEDLQAQATVQKGHHFVNGAPLYDRTATQRVAIKSSEMFDLIKGKKVPGDEEIWVDGKPVYFTTDPKMKLLFGKNYGTQEVIVTDVKECPELVLIYERETSKQLKAWCVDTTQPTKKITQGGQLPICEEEIFIADEIAPLGAPQPIIAPLVP
jgi:hypothetical protein